METDPISSPLIIPEATDDAMRVALGAVELVCALVVTLAATSQLNVTALEEDLQRRAAYFARTDSIRGTAINLMLARLPNIVKDLRTAAIIRAAVDHGARPN